jgi:hypothetical protein
MLIFLNEVMIKTPPPNLHALTNVKTIPSKALLNRGNR